QSGERAHGLGGNDTVRRQAVVPLELADGGFGLRAEDAVDTSGVESEGREAILKVAHVVPAEVGRGEVQDPVAESPGCLDELAPGFFPDDAVDVQAALLLEGYHAHLGPRAEDAA